MLIKKLLHSNANISSEYQLVNIQDKVEHSKKFAIKKGKKS